MKTNKKKEKKNIYIYIYIYIKEIFTKPNILKKR